jgi:hypothetical protein
MPKKRRSEGGALATASLRIDATADNVEQVTAEWLSRFHPDVNVALGGSSVTISSDRHDESVLRQLWQAALLNERLRAAGEFHRRKCLENLVS